MSYALVDANVLLVPAQFKVDIWRELAKLDYSPIVLSCVLNEVRKIAEGRSKDKGAARVALQLIRLKKPKIIKERGPADSALIRVAKRRGYAVATNDRILINKLKIRDIRVIRLKQKKFLVVE